MFSTNKMESKISLGFTIRMLLLQVPQDAVSLIVKIHMNNLQDAKSTVTCDERTFPVEFVPVEKGNTLGEVWIEFDRYDIND